MGIIILVISVFLLIGIVLFFGDKKRSGPFRTRRSFYFLMAMTGLLIMIWKPNYPVKVAGITAQMGSGTDSLSTPFTSVHDLLLADEWPEFDTVIISKKGVTIEDLEMLNKVIKIRNPDPSDKIPYVDMPEVVTEQEIVELHLYENSDIESEYHLTTPESDEIVLTKKEDGIYTCKFNAPVTGEYVYDLTWRKKNGDSMSMLLPLIVREKPQIELLMLLSAPFYEMNYLKNYWVGQGHGFSQRIQISREKYWTGFVNTKEKNLSRLNEETLAEFDILISDLLTWNGLSVSGRSAILEEVENRGFGLMLVPTQAGQVPKDLPYINLDNSLETKINDVLVSQMPVQKNSVWETVYHNLQEVGEELSLGPGKVVVPRLGGTFALILEGQEGAYQDLWASLFNKIYSGYPEKWYIYPDEIPIAGKNVGVTIFDELEDAEYFINGGIQPIPTIVIPFLESVKEATITPLPGWNKLSSTRGEMIFYAYDGQALTGINDENIVENYIQSIDFDENERASRMISRPLPWWLGLAVFVLGLGMLWLDERIYGVVKNKEGMALP